MSGGVAARLTAEFDLDRGIAYLNSGSQSITPRTVFAEMQRYQREYESNPTAGIHGQWTHLWKAQQRVAEFFGARAEDLFLRATVSDALNDFILGIPLPSGGEILLSDLEYGAIVNQARFRAERDGLRLRRFHLPFQPAELAGLTAARLTETVVAALQPDTRMLILSHVVTGTGLVLPLAEIARETRRRGVMLVIDAAHGPGSVPVDLGRLADVDFYGGNLHKWMMGPKGTAFGWVSPRHQDALQPRNVGWTTYEVSEPYTAFGGGSRFATRHMISASQDFSPFQALDALISFWEKHGAEKLRTRIYELQSHAEKRADSRLGWPKLSPAAGSLRGPLLTYALPEPWASRGSAFVRELYEGHRVQVSTPMIAGKSVLRLSPHVYNTEAELERGIEAIAKLAGT